MNRPLAPLIDIQDLTTWYPIKAGILGRTTGYVKAVDGVSLRIHKGETVGLVGESGCGKTSLGRTLLRLTPAKSGKILFEGRDLLTKTSKEMKMERKNIQIIFQDPISSLNPRMTILDSITEGVLSFGAALESVEATAKKLMKEVGLPGETILRYPHEFSGGQCQRISIARAISVRPKFIVCDEAVSALDVSVQAQIINLLIELQERHNISYLFISHDLNIISHIADRIAVMYLGKIVECAQTKTLMDNPHHPYTQSLINAIPRPGVYRKTDKSTLLEGEPPSPINPPGGCPFHPRCAQAMAICERVPPRLQCIDKREIACHLKNTENARS